MYQAPTSPLSEEALQSLCLMLSNWQGVPEAFKEDFEVWAKSWPHVVEDDSEPEPKYWVHVRPYTMVELANQPGMPGRTKLYEIIKSLPTSECERRNVGGKLTPRIVELILKRLNEPAPHSERVGEK